MLKKIYNHLRVKGKPLTVHTEMVVDDKVWEKVKQKALNNKVHKWYLITPYNYELFKNVFTLKMSKEDFEKKLISRYQWLMNHNQNLQLHVHLSKNMKNITKKEQKEIITNSLKWLEKITENIISEIVFGWWNYNQDTEDIVEELNLKLIKRFDYKECHDYDWIRNPEKKRKNL